MARPPSSTDDSPAVDRRGEVSRMVDAFADLARQGWSIGANAAASTPAMLRFAREDPLGLQGAFTSFLWEALKRPDTLLKLQASLVGDYLNLTWQMTKRVFGAAPEPMATPADGDRRFTDDAWTDHPLFNTLQQLYLITSRRALEAVRGVEGLEPASARRMERAAQMMVDALAPTNFVLTNPTVLKTILESRGRNLVRGFDNFLADLRRSRGLLDISMTDREAFEVGENLAITPGQVVFQNDLMQLIQYDPTTEQVARRPLLIVPPPLNKYYILDLRPENSMVRWLVEQGHTVFCISWVNPDASHAHQRFEDYMRTGVLAALDAVERATGEREVNAVGYCYGGILLTATLAYLGAIGDDRVRSATFLTTLIDFEDVGDVGVFADAARLPQLEQAIAEKGYLDGRAVAGTFRALRANELWWNYFVNNYLLGESPPPFDMLYWNTDFTNLPAAMHNFVMRELYVNNRLREPGGLNLLGQPIDLASIQIPGYFVSPIGDTIAPWRSCFPATQLFGGPVKFILAKSGHIAGVVNPPSQGKYGYWTRPDNPAEPETWRAGAELHAGSWWPDWNDWLSAHRGHAVAPREPGAGELAPIEAAPGSYVRVRLDQRTA